MKRCIKSLVAVLLVCLFTGCSDVALTGRSQLNFVPDSYINNMADSSYQEFLTTAKLSEDKAKTAMVEQVGKNICEAVDKYQKQIGVDTSGFAWEVKLVEDETVNAWCMPGGKIVVYTGILKHADTPDKLAIVMGHEVAHAMARHGAERMSHELAAQGVFMVSDYAMKEQSESRKQIFQMAIGAGTQYGFLLPYSRKHEYEADEIGLLVSTLAGYNPDVAVEFWQSMSEGEQGSSDFFSTHPASSKRIDRLKEITPGVKDKAQAIKNM